MTNSRALEICKIIKSNFGVIRDGELAELRADTYKLKPHVQAIVRETLAGIK